MGGVVVAWKMKRTGTGVDARTVITLPPDYGSVLHTDLIGSGRRPGTGWRRRSGVRRVARGIRTLGRGVARCVATTIAAAIVKAVAEPMPALHAL